MNFLSTTTKHKVLSSMASIIDKKRNSLIEANKKDLNAFNRDDEALYQRLIVDDKKVDEMIKAIQEVDAQEDPIGNVIDERTLDSGLKIINKTDPFGTILIIYESRPDVTIEAAVLAFKANNKILLKGGKEAYHSNIALVECWHEALKEHNLSTDWIKYMVMNRQETQEFLRKPTEKLDLIVPRGGERLIKFVKEHARCAVLISGRGNNFMYVAPDANWKKATDVIINSKTNKISGCNALDKVLFDANIENLEQKVKELSELLHALDVEILADRKLVSYHPKVKESNDEASWKEEFLAKKILFGQVNSLEEAIERINTNSGKHSNGILTEDSKKAAYFMQNVDSAAVYHNASTRFTDGGQMGVGAELAISTDKLHHRGPLGLKQLVTNKYYVHGDGHVRS